MSFEVGRLSAALTLDGVPEFHRELDSAGRKLTETGQRGASFGKAAEAAIRTAAGATTSLVAAGGAYLAILTKQGIAYNSLQQNSRAALSVILGGAEKANAQMGKLDDFARNSPFAKSVFIQAQQQLLGFGVEAGKVIPTLDAIQQTVASFGGNADQITSITDVLARLQSQGRLSGEALERLGYYGVDAAKIIGQEMGLTAAEIKEMASKPGGIPVDQIWDPLVTGLQKNFGGAADNVKQQWSGAVDRIKAAQRDLGAHLAEPFVSAQGGGMAVTWGNQVANVLRAIEKQAIPVMGILTQRGMPFFAGLTEGLDSAQQAIQRWNPASLEISLDKMAGHAPGIAALAGATLALGAQVGPLGTMLKSIGISANPVVAAFVGIAAASPEVRAALGDLLATGKPLIPVVGDLATVLSGALNSALPVVADGVSFLASVLGPIVKIFAEIPTPVIAGAAAFLAMHKAAGPLQGVVLGVADSLRGLAARGAGTAVEEVAGGIGNIGSASNIAKGGVLKLGDALKTAFLSNPIGIALTVVAVAIGAWAAANAAAQQKVEDHKNRVAGLKETLNETTGALTEATEAQTKANLAETRASELAAEMGIKYRDIEQAILGNADAQERVSAGMTKHWEENAVTLKESDDALNSWSASAVNARNRNSELSEILEEQKAAIEDAIRAKQDAIQADREAAAAMTDVARSNQRFNDALQVARDITQDAEARVRALKQALDELKGGAISAEEAQKRLSETNLSLAEGLAQSNEAGTKLWQSTLDGTGAIDLSTRSGLAFADSMGRSRDAMLDAAMAAADQALANGDLAGAVAAAQAAGDGYIATLQKTMTEAELTQAQIDGLIGKYLDVPAVVATLLTDNGSISEVDQAALALIASMSGIPEGESITIDNPGGPEVLQRLKDLGFEANQIPGSKQISITQVGAQAVTDAIRGIVNTSWTATINVRANMPDLNGAASGGGRSGFHDGGIVSRIGRQFDNGGFASGIYNGVMGGIPKMGVDGFPHLFAEKHLGVDWETYISSKSSRQRNAMLLMETAQRIGFPVIPASALRGIRGFADGGSVGGAHTASTQLAASIAGPPTEWNMTIVNPVVRDPFEQAWNEVQEKGAL